MMVTIIQVPYDSGHFGERMGRGPLALIEGGVKERLQRGGHDAELVEVRLKDRFWPEVGAAIEIQCRVAEAVRGARSAGRLPVILAGNCNYAALGAMGVLDAATTGVVWLDAHGDLNTPETTLSGFFDGMALSLLTDNSWKGVAGVLAQFTPVPEGQVILAGARDLDPAEVDVLRSSEIAYVPPAEIESLGGHLDRLGERADSVYLHVDLDVLDISEARVNQFAAAEGLTLIQVVDVISRVGESLEIAAVGITAYDPSFDADGRALRAAEVILDSVIETAASR